MYLVRLLWSAPLKGPATSFQAASRQDSQAVSMLFACCLDAVGIPLRAALVSGHLSSGRDPGTGPRAGRAELGQFGRPLLQFNGDRLGHPGITADVGGLDFKGNSGSGLGSEWDQQFEVEGSDERFLDHLTIQTEFGVVDLDVIR
jgi:hypothetical protein